MSYWVEYSSLNKLPCCWHRMPYIFHSTAHTVSLYIVYSCSVDPLFCLLGLLNGLLLLLLALGVEVVQVEGGHHVLLLEEELLDLAAHDGRHPAILLTIL